MVIGFSFGSPVSATNNSKDKLVYERFVPFDLPVSFCLKQQSTANRPIKSASFCVVGY
jgi:hypothetical protein